MMKERILIIEDDEGMQFFLSEALQKQEYKVFSFSDAEKALTWLEKEACDLILLDIKLPGMDGIEAIDPIRGRSDAAIIVITAFGNKKLALDAIHKGAYDYFTKPFLLDEMEVTIKRALEKGRLQKELVQLRKKAIESVTFPDIIGQGHVIKQVFRQVARAAETDATVLILGETGTGKELAAHATHARSRRTNGPFIIVNCSSLSESLLESELFGHLKGAFTGACSDKVGLFDAATGGTIFLDEIDSTSQQIQLSLLRVLEDKQVRPVGSVSRKMVDVRVIASTQRDLFKLTKEGAFREDLYYRISAITITLPPLRERIEDVPLLAEHFLRKLCKQASKQPRSFSTKALESLMSYHWPGNVRELENVIKQAVLFSQEPVINQPELSIFIQNGRASQENHALKKLDDMEREHLVRVLVHTRNNKTRAARILGIPRTTLYQKMKKHLLSSDAIQEELLRQTDG